MKSREHNSPEFRAESVRLVLEQGLGQAEAARSLGIAKGTLSNWVVAAKGGKDTHRPAFCRRAGGWSGPATQRSRTS